jgi:peptidoglycan/xylan/chitin deacetylase (PgdA/CDA1 family)
MFNGKIKAVTFSYDDGVTQDRRLIEIFNKFGLKATFNINSELLGNKDILTNEYGIVNHSKVEKEDVALLYKGHEVAVHTCTHPNLTTLKEEEIIRQVEEDRKNLEVLVHYPIVGMAYPCGGINNNNFIAEVIKNNTPIKYARTITENYSFDLQDNLIRFNPTVYHMNTDKMFELAEKFIELSSDLPQIFYIWGHSYEFDFNDTWDMFEKFCKLIANRRDIFYGTNKEVLIR